MYRKGGQDHMHEKIRHLSEKIHFKDNSIVAADWNKELGKEHVISAVSLRKWLLIWSWV